MLSSRLSLFLIIPPGIVQVLGLQYLKVLSSWPSHDGDNCSESRAGPGPSIKVSGLTPTESDSVRVRGTGSPGADSESRPTSLSLALRATVIRSHHDRDRGGSQALAGTRAAEPRDRAVPARAGRRQA